jgi:BirA family biotin operon repressor/biotin-[acetyl-CoA-carboxylase] ligase
MRQRQALEVLENGYTVYTHYQTAGRGQRGNFWESARAENLLFSTLFIPDSVKANKQFVISQVISLAIKDVLDKKVSDISIKWPNDIYWKDKKIAGILIENDLIDDFVDQSIIGVGLNLNQTVFQSNAPNPVSLRLITGGKYDAHRLLEEILDRLAYYATLITQKEHVIAISYKNALFRKEGYHLFSENEIVFSAKIINIEDTGMLVLETREREIRKYAFKEVSYVL